MRNNILRGSVGKNKTHERKPGKGTAQKDGTSTEGELPGLIQLKRKIESGKARDAKYFKVYPEGLVVPPEISCKKLQEMHNIQVPEVADFVLRRLEVMNRTWAIKASKLTSEDRKVWMPNNEMRFWQIPRRTGIFLYWIARQTAASEILELGTSAGYSGIWLALGARQSNGTVYTADMSPLKIAMSGKNFEAAGIENVVQLKGTIAEILATWHKPIDLVFLDADKQNYASYLQMVLPKLKKGGYVVADNAMDYMELMGSLINELRDSADKGHKLHSYVLKLDNGIYVIRKEEPIDNQMITSFFNAKINFM